MKKWLLLLFIPSLSFAAISLDTTANSAGKKTTDFSYSITIGAGSNELLIVGVACSAGLDPTITVKDGTTSMTQAQTTFNINRGSKIFYLSGLSSGAHTLNVTIGASNYCRSAALSLFGVTQTSPVDVTGGATDHSATESVPLTTTLNNTWIFSVNQEDDFGCTWTSSNQTIFYQNADASTNSSVFAYMGPNTPAGSFAPALTCAGTVFNAMSATAYKPFAASSNNGILLGTEF